MDRAAGYFLSDLLRKAFSPIINFGGIAVGVRDLDQPLPGLSLPAGMHVFLASREDIGRILEAHDPSRSGPELKERFQRGDYCFAVMSDRSVIHTRWVSIKGGWIPELGAEVILRSGEAYMYDCYTQPLMRGRGIDRAAQEFVFRALRDWGFTRTYAYVRCDHPKRMMSVREFERLAGKLRYVRFRGFRPLVVGSGGSDMPILIRRPVRAGEPAIIGREKRSLSESK